MCPQILPRLHINPSTVTGRVAVTVPSLIGQNDHAPTKLSLTYFENTIFYYVKRKIFKYLAFIWQGPTYRCKLCRTRRSPFLEHLCCGVLSLPEEGGCVLPNARGASATLCQP